MVVTEEVDTKNEAANPIVAVAETVIDHDHATMVEVAVEGAEVVGKEEVVAAEEAEEEEGEVEVSNLIKSS